VDRLISALGKAIYFPFLARWSSGRGLAAWQGLIRKRATRTIEGYAVDGGWPAVAPAIALSGPARHVHRGRDDGFQRRHAAC